MKKSNSKILVIIILCTVFACKEQANKQDKEPKISNTQNQETEEVLYRPNYHFTPDVGWMNDPNGMFYYNGYYHLYYQHYPDGNKWGPMHWGHATSNDMIKWKEQPIALFPDEKGYIFSGSAVVDIENTSGFGTDGKVPIIAIFTYHNKEREKAKRLDVESQAIAYSLDEGLTWTKYSNNPVIKNPGIKDFRDPKVSWNAEYKKWVMVLAAHDKVMFYSSKDLKSWELLSDFGDDLSKKVGTHGGVWECPDLFPLPIEGSNETKWVLYVSVNPGGPNGGSATQYFIGDFDGTTFTMDKEFEENLNNNHNFWIDFGKDNYAGVTFSNISSKTNGKFYMGWMSNWEYANDVPTETWRSAMTLAREIKMIKDNNSYRLSFKPVEEINSYKGKKFKKEDIKIKEPIILLQSANASLSHSIIDFEISNFENQGFTFKLSNDKENNLLFGYNENSKVFFIDRSKSGKTDFSEKFSKKISVAKRISNNKKLTGKIILDKTSIEIFFDGGSTVMTEIFFPETPFEKLSLESNKGLTLETLIANELNIN
ncbi:glycoside hydrolase family 32 protein [Zobellia alginiliquefaciens]|uniref:glycoside hydrolase family 32 protein n=1 Tax=Zobellia alginiliquefaciens TaxID=3032586 RepID=UPI0023E1C95D|nr:glycoside hydrolase family 32 protein [Zobellia alginiliquefaciens]